MVSFHNFFLTCGTYFFKTCCSHISLFLSSPEPKVSHRDISLPEVDTKHSHVRDLIVEIHNHFRDSVEPQASNMLEMVSAERRSARSKSTTYIGENSAFENKRKAGQIINLINLPYFLTVIFCWPVF